MPHRYEEECLDLWHSIQERTLHAAETMACRDLSGFDCNAIYGRLRALGTVVARERKATARLHAYLEGPDTREAGEDAIKDLRFYDEHLTDQERGTLGDGPSDEDEADEDEQQREGGSERNSDG